MKIAYILNSGNFGGMEQHVLFLCEGMLAKGYEVYVWCGKGPLTTEFEHLGVKVVTRKIYLDIDPLYFFKLAGFLKKNDIEIVHAHELKSAVNALIAAFIARVPVRISHTHTPISEWQINKIKKAINLLVYPIYVNLLATYEMALTPSRKKIKIKEGIKKDKLVVLDSPNGVKIEDFHFENEEKRLYREEILTRFNIPITANVWGCIGRISEEKGHQVLLEAFGKFLTKLPEKERKDHYLVLIGGGPLEKEMQENVKKMGLQEKVFIAGRFPAEDQKKYYAALDYFVHPSLAEGFGIVLLEAMTVGLPVLASDLEVFTEVGRDTINYFKTGDSDDLAKKMSELCTMEDEIIKQRQRAYRRVKDFFTFDKFVNSYETFYLQLLIRTK